MNIKFANGTNFEYINALETEEYFNGANRRTLTFECEVGVIGVNELNTLLNDEKNTAAITLTSNGVPVFKTNPEDNSVVIDEKGTPIVDHYESTTNIYDGYVLKLKCGIENKLNSAETPEAQAVYADRLVFKLGKRTYIEEQLKRLGL